MRLKDEKFYKTVEKSIDKCEKIRKIFIHSF